MSAPEKEMGGRDSEGDIWTPLETKTPYALKSILEDGRKVIMFAPNDPENPFIWSVVSISAPRNCTNFERFSNDWS